MLTIRVIIYQITRTRANKQLFGVDGPDLFVISSPLNPWIRVPVRQQRSQPDPSEGLQIQNIDLAWQATAEETLHCTPYPHVLLSPRRQLSEEEIYSIISGRLSILWSSCLCSVRCRGSRAPNNGVYMYNLSSMRDELSSPLTWVLNISKSTRQDTAESG